MKRLSCWIVILGMMIMLVGLTGTAVADENSFTDTFRMEDCNLGPRGDNAYFPMLKPGYCLLLEGEEDGETVTVLITVLPKTKMVDGVRCAVVREKEWIDGELVEISWNYFAICKKHKGVFYFGEKVDIYEDGEVVSHDGAWLAGEDGATAGLIMPGYPLVGSRYYQEIAPGVALDRAEHISVTASIVTPAGSFENCLEVEETTPLEPNAESTKIYAPGIGLVQDDVVELVGYGFGIKCDLDDDDDDDGKEGRRGHRRR